MGLFDNNVSNKKYNDAIINCDVDDNVYIVNCGKSCDNCKYKDIKLNRCLFETCIYDYRNIKYHKQFTTRCHVCKEEFTKTINNYSDINNITLCDKCHDKLINLIIRGVNENDE